MLLALPQACTGACETTAHRDAQNNRWLFTHSTVSDALLVVEDYDIAVGVRWQDRLTEWLHRVHGDCEQR